MPTFAQRLTNAVSIHEQQAIIDEARKVAKQYAIQHPQTIAVEQVARAESAYKAKATLGSPNTETAYENYIVALIQFADAISPPTE